MFPSFLSSVYSLSWKNNIASPCYMLRIGLHTHYGAICSNWGRGKVAITPKNQDSRGKKQALSLKTRWRDNRDGEFSFLL